VVPSEASRQRSCRPSGPAPIPGRACPSPVHLPKSERRWRPWPVGLEAPCAQCQARPARGRGRGLDAGCPTGQGLVPRCWAATGSARARPGWRVGHDRQSTCPAGIGPARW
jgi:hypothetical protein